MARTTYVKRAQPRFRTVPVLDEDGKPKTTPVLRRDGSPRTTKTGRPVMRRVTVEDHDQPLPNRRCESCGKEITVGSPYKWVRPKSGPYGGSKRVRCGTCPTWQPWELSNALWAQIQRVTDGARDAAGGTTDGDQVADALREAAEGIREIAEGKREGAQNIEDGFGHPTEMSEELANQADELDSWADDIEARADDIEPEPDDQIECDACDGSGKVEVYPEDDEHEASEVECDECGGDCSVENPEHEDWLASLEDALTVLDESPV